MTIPLLTPADTSIFDEDVIRELEDHADDTPICECLDECDAPATARVIAVCCRRYALGCAVHAAQTKARFDATAYQHRPCGAAPLRCTVVDL